MAASTIPLSEILELAINPCPVEPDAAYPILGVYGFARGPIARPPVRGSEISATTLYKVKKGQLVYSRLKAFEGAYTVVPPELDGYFTSNEFPAFDVDPDRADHRYLQWLFRQPSVWRAIAVGSKGIGARRERVHPDQVLSYQIDLPALDEQRRIVKKLDRVASLVEDRRRAIEATEHETQALLLKAFQRAIDGAPLRPMAEIAPLVRRPIEINPDASYPELGVRSFGRGTFHKPDLLGAELSWQKLFLVQQGDLVFSNIKAWEGAFAVASPEDHGRVGSHRYLTCVPIIELATAEFIWFYLQTSEGLGKVQSASRGSADRNRTLGQGALEAITVPTPTIRRQHWFDRLQAKAREARAIRASTAKDVETLIPAMLHEIFEVRTKAA
ncbi:restriction endonuclease subunit S [Glycocaulis profundi]|nr:restriction endonuclease subunit S [Glycocaulis profundi]